MDVYLEIKMTRPTDKEMQLTEISEAHLAYIYLASSIKFQLKSQPPSSEY